MRVLYCLQLPLCPPEGSRDFPETAGSLKPRTSLIYCLTCLIKMCECEDSTISQWTTAGNERRRRAALCHVKDKSMDLSFPFPPIYLSEIPPVVPLVLLADTPSLP